MKVFEKHLTVTSDHLDFNDHVNNLVYLQWAVEISREHWQSEITDTIDQRYFWIVRTHQVTYKRQAFEGDQITIRTFVESLKGPFSDRVVRIFKDQDLLVEAKTTWCLIDRETQKPVKVPEEIKALF